MAFIMGAILTALPIREEQREVLEEIVRKRNAKAGLVMRARIILMAADGVQRGASFPAAPVQRAISWAKWAATVFRGGGSLGSTDEPRSGRPGNDKPIAYAQSAGDDRMPSKPRREV